MLNYIWLALILLGVGAALTTDVVNNSIDKYRNDIPFNIILSFEQNIDLLSEGKQPANISITAADFSSFYNYKINSDLAADVDINFNKDFKEGFISIKVDENSPSIWKEMAAASGEADDLTGKIKLKERLSPNSFNAVIVFDAVSFIKMNDVTSAVISYAGTAVTIALGLIGIMALWLGVMKVAEEAGLIKIIARSLKPFTKRLFPEIPSDHPAMSSMIMNISANMLGLELDRDPVAWMDESLRAGNIQLLPLTPAVAVASAQLGSFHGDPADRLIVATALTHGASLVTKDERIWKQGLVKTAW